MLSCGESFITLQAVILSERSEWKNLCFSDLSWAVAFRYRQSFQLTTLTAVGTQLPYFRRLGIFQGVEHRQASP